MEATMGINSGYKRHYLGGQYELENQVVTKEWLYLGGNYYTAPAVLCKANNSRNVFYLLRDHLGSITNIILNNTQIGEYSYDAWGRLRNPQTHTLYNLQNEPSLYLGRGYCGHEHIKGTGLINMNARLYDPLIGRFLSPDPYVQAPENSQNFNRYSYCLNNPLKYTDPSGELFGIDDLIIIAGVVVGAYLGGSIANGGQYNPAKWNYSSFKTYAGIVGGGVLGGFAGSAVAAGSLGVKIGVTTPFVAAGVNIWRNNNNQYRHDFETSNPAGNEWHSYDSSVSDNAGKAYDSALESMNQYYTASQNSIDGVNASFEGLERYGASEVKAFASYTNVHFLRPFSNITSAINVLSEPTQIHQVKKGLMEMGKNYGAEAGGYIVGTAMSGVLSATGVGVIGASSCSYLGYSLGYVSGGIIGERLMGFGFDMLERGYSFYRSIPSINFVDDPMIKMQFSISSYNIYGCKPL